MDSGKKTINHVEIRKILPVQDGYRMPGEYEPHRGCILIWPERPGSWRNGAREARKAFAEVIRAIAKSEEVYLAASEESLSGARQLAESLSEDSTLHPVCVFQAETDDAWARDVGPTFVTDGQEVRGINWEFNAWGGNEDGLYASWEKDNDFAPFFCEKEDYRWYDARPFVLEGGSIESDGLGTLLTTSECLLSPNRNGQLNKVEIEEYLRSTFHLERVLWLDYGYLAGDDTDSHIDTLARFCSPDTIAYVQCRDVNDEHYEELHQMEEQLKTFQTLAGEPYKLLALPMADKIEVEGERLPATYANFLIMNNAVLYPTYNQPENDMRAQEVLQKAFPEHEIVGVDCRALIKQHGSLHCVTMQYPMGVIK